MLVFLFFFLVVSRGMVLIFCIVVDMFWLNIVFKLKMRFIGL